MANVVFLVHCFNDPVVKLLVHGLGVGVDLLEGHKSPGVDEAESVDEYFLLLVENSSLKVIFDLLNRGIIGCVFLQLLNEA